MSNETLVRSERIDAWIQLGSWLGAEGKEELHEMMQKAEMYNPWFTVQNIERALFAIQTQMLENNTLKAWVARYPSTGWSNPKRVGLILAGNIPAVGFHDVLCCLISGHKALIKLSDKDKVIIPFLLNKLVELDPVYGQRFEWVDQLKNIDAVIATGSDNSGLYFQSYFGKYPNIIRKHRNSVAVLDGTESEDDLLRLGKDIFEYFGLGCRNVSKIFIPLGYRTEHLLEALHHYNDLIHHHKYKNNFDYNIALYLINKVKYQNNGCLILVEDSRLTSRIASLHYEYYHDAMDLQQKLEVDRDKIQCIVGRVEIPGQRLTDFGSSQQPQLDDYADGTDTMAFLGGLS